MRSPPSRRPSSEIGLPASIHGQFPGHGASVPSIAGQRADAHRRRAGNGLHRARYALREHDPPDHDSVHLAVGGSGRAAGAAAMPHRTERHRADRHYLADRHRQEERHHDDRFRARGRAHRRQEPGGRDLPGLSAALPADHDDDDGGALGRAAAGAGIGSRIGTATAAGNRHRRWA